MKNIKSAAIAFRVYDEDLPRITWKSLEPSYKRFCTRVPEIKMFMGTRLRYRWGARNYAFIADSNDAV